MEYEVFERKLSELNLRDKVSLYNEFCTVNTNEAPIYHLDEQFFLDNFTSYMQLAEKIGMTGIDMDNEWVWFDNSYNDLETLSEDEVNDIIDGCSVSMYTHEEIWKHYITED
jgi:hypothetical protein